MTPSISICIPTHQAAAVLPRCLESILDQGSALADAEIIVSDSASTEDSPSLAERLLRSTRSSRIVRQPTNLGRIGNWNACFRLCRGKWIKFLMVNDVLLPGSLALLRRGAELAPDTVLVTSQHRSWHGGLESLEPVAESTHARIFTPRDAVEILQVGGDPFWALNGALIHRPTAVDNGLEFNDPYPYVADETFCLLLALSGSTVFLETPTYGFSLSAANRFHYSGMATPTEAHQLYALVDRSGLYRGLHRARAGRRTLALSCALSDQNEAVAAAARRALPPYPCKRLAFELWRGTRLLRRTRPVQLASRPMMRRVSVLGRRRIDRIGTPIVLSQQCHSGPSRPPSRRRPFLPAAAASSSARRALAANNHVQPCHGPSTRFVDSAARCR